MAEDDKWARDSHPDYRVDGPPADLPEGHVTRTGFSYQLRFLWKALMRSPTRNVLFFTFLIIFVLICLIAFGQLAINSWMKNFWSAIEARDVGEFMRQLGIFLLIAGGLLVLNLIQTFLNQYFKLKLREGLTNDLIGQWLQPKRAYRLRLSGEIGVNPDQRLHEDARHLAESTADLAINLLQATITLFLFIHVLWLTSAGFVFNFHGRSFALPGYMVWAVILYAGSASFLTWLVGHRLVFLNADRYAKEAELRAALMRVNQSIEAVTLVSGERAEKSLLAGKVDDVLAAIWKIVLAMTRLTGITAAYGWISNIAPVVIAAPIYFGGGINLGGLMQAVNSFNQAHNSLRWFVDNYGALADWRATMLRIATFRQALGAMDGVNKPQSGRIRIVTRREKQLMFNDFTIRTANGCITIDPARTVIKRGQRVAVDCTRGVDGSILFQAMGGLWPWGSGKISFPAADCIAYIPWRTYLPSAPLRDVLLYPACASTPDDTEITDLLNAAGLQHFTTMLDRKADWDKILGDSEKQCLALVRAILQKVDFIILENVFNTLENSTRLRMEKLIGNRLQHAAIVNLAGRHSKNAFFTREIKARFHTGLSE
ncbi:MAG: ABC transporter transmembrane domain [Candidatus Tokpelaia hoelldobleri]|uniref:ABC transporter transmembrane domain n=1 Tax=Candidatus Tokpelaia hoelldobleri TaxID=1902579 RepID=A0A1U9JUZ2_9HYPH|nr:MAG: ABC transporter transmembrane domain [Candidatus Tokpelaia hoelldoblerii]